MRDEKKDKIALDQVLNFDPERMNSSNSAEIMEPNPEASSSVYIKFKIENHNEQLKKFPIYIKDNIRKIAELEEFFNKQQSGVALAQINNALACMTYYQKNNKLTSSPPQRWAYINASDRTSLFEIFIDMYTAILANMPSCIFHSESGRQYMTSILEEMFGSLKVEPSHEKPTESKHCAQIIFDSGDLNAALYHLDFATEDKTSPWRIRCCWIQESLKERFFQIIQTKSVSAFKILIDGMEKSLKDATEEATKLGADVIQNGSSTLIVGAGRKQVDCQDVVFVNFFRTPKEAVALVNGDRFVQCASIWTENISIGLEMAHRLNVSNIWINSNGVIDPNVPFTFGDNIIYGSEMGPLQQYAGQSSIDISAMTKDDYESALIENYSMAKTLEKQAFYVTCNSKPKDERQIFAKLLKDIDSAQDRNLIANMALNKLKTICIPFGSIFAN